jgi:hypothetical protein
VVEDTSDGANIQKMFALFYGQNLKGRIMKNSKTLTLREKFAEKERVRRFSARKNYVDYEESKGQSEQLALLIDSHRISTLPR